MALISAWSEWEQAQTWQPAAGAPSAWSEWVQVVTWTDANVTPSEWSEWVQVVTWTSGKATPSEWSGWVQARTWTDAIVVPSGWSDWSDPVVTPVAPGHRLTPTGWIVLGPPFRRTPTGWVPFRLGGVPPVKVARQLLGMTVQASGGGISPAVDQDGEDLRLGTTLGWSGGPAVQRIFQQTQGPPNSHMETILSQGRMPWLSHKPQPGGVAADAAGANDAFWSNYGAYLAQFYPQRIWYSYDHENDRNGGSSPNRSDTGWVQYQNDFRNAFVRIIGLMRAADPVNGLSHVEFGPILTGYAYRGASNRDPGLSWHPDFDFMAADPYDFWLYNDGTLNTPRRDLFTTGTLSTGAREHYEFCTDPVGWYATYHPAWPVPQLILDNLHRFPFRMGIAETGTSFDMKPNAEGTQWVPQEDPDDPANYQGAWITEMGRALREDYPRLEVVCYFHAGTQPIGSSEGHPVYFAGPAANRWGAHWQGSIDAMVAEVQRDNHTGELTPWTPVGLA